MQTVSYMIASFPVGGSHTSKTDQTGKYNIWKYMYASPDFRLASCHMSYTQNYKRYIDYIQLYMIFAQPPPPPPPPHVSLSFYHERVMC